MDCFARPRDTTEVYEALSLKDNIPDVSYPDYDVILLQSCNQHLIEAKLNWRKRIFLRSLKDNKRRIISLEAMNSLCAL
jgi:hypothetical protein